MAKKKKKPSPKVVPPHAILREVSTLLRRLADVVELQAFALKATAPKQPEPSRHVVRKRLAAGISAGPLA